MQTSDGQIIRHCLNGDSEAFGLLVDKYKASVYSLAYSKVHNFHDAEEIAQEVFIKAYKNLHTLKYYDRFHAWVYSITINLCKNWLRDNFKSYNLESIEEQDSKVLDILSIEQHREERILETVREALEALPEKYCISIILHYFVGMTSEEIAEFMGTTPTAVRHYLNRGRNYLKENTFAGIYGIFQRQLPQADFTFRVLEVVRRIGINPKPWPKSIPWGISLATGFIFLILSMGIRSGLEYPLFNQIDNTSGNKITSDNETPIVFIQFPIGPKSSAENGNEENISFSPDIENEELSLSSNKGEKWLQKAEMPTKRFSLSISEIDRKIYAFGGMLGTCTKFIPGEGMAPNWELFDTVEVYDPSSDIWERRLSMPTAKAWFSTAVVDGIAYTIGGRLGGCNASPTIGTVEAYNPKTDSWFRKSDMPTARAGHSASVLNGMIYVIGGSPDGKEILNTVEVYDPNTDTWSKKPNMPNPRAFFGSGVVNGKIYIFGGNSDSLSANTLITMEAYDPDKETWEKKADLPTAVTAMGTCVYGGKIYVFGGTKGRVDSWFGTSTVYVYDPLTDNWTQKADMPTARRNLSVSVLNGKIYAIGGGYNLNEDVLGALGTVEEYEPEQSISVP